MSASRKFFGVLLAPALLATHAFATTWVVPPGGAIQPVINGTLPGDTVFISPSTTPYNQALTMPNWDITLTGSYGGTVLSGAGLGAPVISFPSGNMNTNNTVVSNLTIKGANLAGSGGAIFVQGGSRPTFRNLLLTNNTATSGGAMYLDLTVPVASPTMKISRVVFRENSAADGGALYMTGSGVGGPIVTTPSVSVLLSHFESNNALTALGGNGFGGGALVTGGPGAPKIRFDHSWFQENHAESEGGGLFAWFKARVEVAECSFALNTANWRGGGISVEGAYEFRVDDSTFDDDNCSDVLSEGGHLYMNAQSKGLHPYTVENCLFHAGDAYNGGAVTVADTDVAILHSTFTDNDADAAFGIGGALHTMSFASLTTVVDCIFWGDGAGLPDPSALGELEIATDFGALPPAVSFSDVMLTAGTYPVPFGVGTPNLNANPQLAFGYTCSWSPLGKAFLNATGPVSPCIDAGSMAFTASGIPANWTTNTAGTPDAGTVDIGFHYPPTSCP
ncbi:MAG: hypothetical protein EPO68_05150 [Planctomycetota bacterium]|nr:MAG: hypothetical protein EPO68_05150 [Planctomycetota bacterium]